MSDFDLKFSALEETSEGLKKGSDSLHEEFENYAKAFLQASGLAYEEGTEIYNALKAAVDEAIRKAERNVEMLATHSTKAKVTAERAEETESNSLRHINDNINVSGNRN